jgi:hypothetical protein
VSTELPYDGMQYRIPLQVLQTRLIPHRSVQIAQVLVHWSELPDSLATWEDRESMQQQFLWAPAWGQATSQDPGNVSTPSLVASSAEMIQVSKAGEGPRCSTRPKKHNVKI